MLRRIVAILALVPWTPSLAVAVEPPLTIHCGLGRIPNRVRELDGSVVPDAAFSVERGYGFVGGRPGRLSEGSVRGVGAERPVTWREGELKYSFRVPRGEYLLRLGFVETHVAGSMMRVFDVVAEDSVILEDVDVFAEVGDFTWHERAVKVGVFDGWLDLRLVAKTGDQLPRVSMISVLPLREEPNALPPAVSLEGRAGPLRNDLRVIFESPDQTDRTAPVTQSVVGYSIVRAESSDGPFTKLTDKPVASTHFRDERVSAGITYFYKARAHGVEGGAGPWSKPLTLMARSADPGGLKTYDLEMAADAFRRAAIRRVPPTFAPAEIVVRDRRFPVQFAYDTSNEGWQRRKTMRIDMSLDRFRSFGKRDELFLSAESGDWTQLREKLSADAGEALGLATPRVVPVIVTINGKPVGLRYDLEDVDSKFRKRVRLDRVGLLARLTGDDDWRSDWSPRGERVGKSGDVVALNELVHELHGLHPGEIEAFFAEALYLDRWIDRLAYAAVRGELDLAPEDALLLRDSRNGKWEMFRARHRSSDWGIRDGLTELLVPEAPELDRVLFPGSQRVGQARRDQWLLLFTRFFHSRFLRDRYLRRIEEILENELAPEAFDEIVDRAFETVREHVLDETDLWPYDSGRTFLGAPGKIQQAHRERAQALLRRIAQVRDEPEEPLVIDRYLLRPESPDAPRWVEVRNRSREPVELRSYRLSDGFDRSPRILSARAILAPGEVFRSQLPDSRDAESFAAHGSLVLWRQETSARRIVSDFVFFGHQTRGVAYGRDASVPSGWRFFHPSETSGEDTAGASPDKIALGRSLAVSPAKYRWSLQRQRSGDLRVDLQLPERARDGTGKIEKVEIRFRAVGEETFRSAPMGWDDKRFAYSLTLEKNDGRPRTDYYFVAETASGIERTYPLGAPDISLAIPVLPNVRINEICPRPGMEPDSPGEFIELVNEGEQPVSIEGFHLSDDQRRPAKWRITEKIVLPPKGYAVFYADGLNRGRHTNFKLSNSGEFVGLYARTEEGYLRIDAAAFRGVPLGQSWGRKQDGTRSFRVWKDPTPGKRNLPKIPDSFRKKASGESEAGEAGREPREQR